MDAILKRDFNLPQGLADSSKVTVGKGKTAKEVHRVQILDPSTGTATFLYGVIGKIHESFANNRGMWSGYVRDHLLPRVIGFELLMAPYTVAHMKLGLLLRETGYTFESDERLRIYLTNTLEDADGIIAENLFANYISEEAKASSSAKSDSPVMVVIGNPPYSGHSANNSDWIKDLLHGKDTRSNEKTGNYFEADGKPLGERNPKWLNDDYVKFMRFAQWRIEKTGYGVLAFITNHGYLDNPTFRGMRQSLMETFDDICILNLHGNSKKKERAPDGGKDENVFDIQQGVSICLMTKRSGAKRETKVHYADLWGVREDKYKALLETDVTSTDWEELSPTAPFYLFTPQDTDLRAEYEAGWRVTEAMPVNVLGFQTHRDNFAIDFEQNRLHSRIEELRDSRISDEDIKTAYSLADNPNWQLSTARQQVKNDVDWERHFVRCLYRIFDWRWCYMNTVATDRPRRELLDHVANKENLCLLSSRQQATLGYKHSWVSRQPANDCVVSTTSREANQVFPLYLYPTGAKASLFDEDAPADTPDGRRANLAPAFTEAFASRLNLRYLPDGKGDLVTTFAPEDIFAYLYAVFHSPAYRSRYAEFLKIDFPRLPLTSDAELFRALCGLGSELVGLHLMETTGTALPNFPEGGSNSVEAIRYAEPNAEAAGRVWINKTQYFEGVAPEVWEFHVGGYQVCAKWLKDRKGRTLSYDDLLHYERICAALSETIRLMTAIDEAIEGAGGFPFAHPL